MHRSAPVLQKVARQSEIRCRQGGHQTRVGECDAIQWRDIADSIIEIDGGKGIRGLRC